jgi:hypothetical protein
MHSFRIFVLTALLCCFTGAAFAGAAAEIGTSFPIGGSAHVSAAWENYAAFTGDALTVEASVRQEKGGLHMELRLTNPTDQAIHIEHPNGQMYDFTIVDEKGKELYRWSAGMAFTEALTATNIPEHGSVVYTADIKKTEYRKLRDEAVLVRMYVKDTSYVVALKVPREPKTEAGSPVTLRGSIELGGHHGW